MSIPNEWKAALVDTEVVSFDVFDTAIVRTVLHPADAFLLLGKEFGLVDPADFARHRISAEKTARDRAWESSGATEITLEQIYVVLAEHYGWPSGETTIRRERERQMERRQCRRNAAVAELYDAARAAGKRVGFISDMYLDEALIHDILSDAGYLDYCFLYLSSVAGETKSTGRLFDKALSDLQVAPDKMLHVGDNHHADIQQAHAAGLRTLFYEKCATRLLADRHLNLRLQVNAAPAATTCQAANVDTELFLSAWQGLAATHKHQFRNDRASPEAFWRDIGYLYVGPLFLGFAVWLSESVKQGGIDRIYFLARDGYIMKEVYDRLRIAGWANADSHYLYASRRALNVPAIEKIDEESTDFLVSGTSRLTVGQFLRRVGLEPSELSDTIRSCGFSGAEHLILSGEDYGRLRALFRAVEQPLLTSTKAEREALEVYFRQQGLLSPGKWAIADIGWHGSLQQSLENLSKRFGGPAQVPGFYLGTFPGAQRYVSRGALHRAYLCELGQPESMLTTIRTSVELFEWIFSAPHGSVIRMMLTEKDVQPVFENAEFEEQRRATASLMQSGALEFVDAFLRQWERPPTLHLPPQIVVRALEELLKAPTGQEAALLGDLPHVEGFGDVQVSRLIAHPSHSIFNPFRWRRLAGQYRNAFWRAGFRRRLNPFK